MSTNIKRKSLGSIELQSGNGAPTHSAPIGSQYTDLDTGIEYINKDGATNWVDTNDVTRVANGVNTFTGGTDNNPTVNVTGLSIDNITVSGASSFQSISAVTFYSGSTDLSDLIGSGGGGGDTTRVANGINTFTGGTANVPTVNVTGLSIDNITVSGESSFQGLSATTLYSGSTDLSDLFGSVTNTFLNGIENISGNTYGLGGVLTQNTTISGGTSNFDLNFGTLSSRVGNLRLESDGDFYTGLDGVLDWTSYSKTGVEQTSYLWAASKVKNLSAAQRYSIGAGSNLAYTWQGNQVDLSPGYISLNSYNGQTGNTINSSSANGFITAGVPSSVEYTSNTFSQFKHVYSIGAENKSIGLEITRGSHYTADTINFVDQINGRGVNYEDVSIDESGVTWSTDNNHIPSIDMIKKQGLTGLSVDNITVSGEASFQSVSATTFYSGSTDLSELFSAGGASKRVYDLDYALSEDVSVASVYFFPWKANSNLRSGASGGLNTQNNCSPIMAPFSGTITEATIVVRGTGVNAGSVTYPVTYATQLYKVGFATEGTASNINFQITSATTVGVNSIGISDLVLSLTGLSISVDKGDMLALKFSGSTGFGNTSTAAYSRNAFIKIKLEED